MAYVYRHIRIDKNEPFYIGVGSDEKYRRAYDTKRRNKFWHYIANKTNYEIEIMLDQIDFKYAKQKEVEFIALYGRKDLGTGTLVNLTNGGDGAFGVKRPKEQMQKLFEFNRGKERSEETKRKISLKNKGKKSSEEVKRKISSSLKGKQNFLGHKHSKDFSLFISELHRGNKYNVGRKRTDEFKRKVSETMKGRLFSEEHKQNCRASAYKRPVLQYTKEGVFVREYESMIAAEREGGFYAANIRKCCIGERKTHRNYIWKFKNQ